ncbi:MAG: diguanylate cyclase [Heliobacteriaceae bacterium]|jgi:diguanylate cyclase (GGDEF)-like protein|nr:diguanylate cyclase [Heliobacteriaceae bacterium]
MFKKISHILGLVFFAVFVFVILKDTNLNTFIDAVENRTFDLRQNIMINAGLKQPDKNIVIIAVDEASYEYILDNYGEWPLPRDVYAKMIDYLELQNPKIIAFDLMFVKSMKSKNHADEALIKAIAKSKNVYVSMNFDNQPEDLRTPPNLPEKLTVNVKNNSPKVDYSDSLTFTNCRAILQGILNSTANIGIINVSRADDGVLRKMPVFAKYKDEYYPQLAFKIGMDYLNNNKKDFVINKNSILKTGSQNIFLDQDGSAVLNWYGPAQTYTYIPMYKLIKAVNGQPTDLKYDFGGKIIYFGTTAASLYDIKTVPSGKLYPGVEVQATYVNNMIDNNFIQRTGRAITVTVSLLLAAAIWIAVMKLESAFTGSLVSLSIYFVYLLSAYYAMRFGNLWAEVIYPLLFSILAFTCAFIVKYLIKSRDFERQYKLATTDGLTDLYNHRYFQEQMKMQVEQSKRYENSFSLIILDIDFFKKFNDTFGHQAGDSVLRQVAFTLKRNVRATDIVCRYGGEEMSIILPNTGEEVALSTAQKICERIAGKPFKFNGDKESHVTVSLGVATYPQDGETASGIIEAADQRLYKAKHSGKNQVGQD